MPWDPYTCTVSTWGSIIFLLISHIHCFKRIVGILHPALIHKTIVTNQNLTISPIFLPAMFFLYLKLSHMPTSLLLKTYFLMNVALDVVIFLNFLKRTLYVTNNPRWLRRVIISIQAPAEYRYIAIRREI